MQKVVGSNPIIRSLLSLLSSSLLSLSSATSRNETMQRSSNQQCPRCPSRLLGGDGYEEAMETLRAVAEKRLGDDELQA
jgi:hypothetical protein